MQGDGPITLAEWVDTDRHYLHASYRDAEGRRWDCSLWFDRDDARGAQFDVMASRRESVLRRVCEHRARPTGRRAGSDVSSGAFTMAEWRGFSMEGDREVKAIAMDYTKPWPPPADSDPHSDPDSDQRPT